MALVTDLGYMPELVKVHLRESDCLLLESNHDLDMLKVGPYPWVVKQRVLSRTGHLSNHAVSEYLCDPEGFDGRRATWCWRMCRRKITTLTWCGCLLKKR